MGSRKNEMMLGGLLIVLAVVLWHQLAGGGGSLSGGPGARGGATRISLDDREPFPVDWAALTAARPAYDPAGRNIFQFGAPPKPVPPPLTDAEKAAIEAARLQAERERLERERAAAEALAAAQAAQAQAAASAAPVNAEPPPPPKPTPPRVTYRFIGYIGPPERKLAVLQEGADLVFGRQGDELGGSFRILEIGYESIKFGYTDRQFKGEFEIVPMTSGGR